ncbi:MAG: hypothetical protein IH994_02490 [Proteobacteria bacterium]|nr:hypothetical protein [Pseudomonadota bacterium]
METFTNIDGRTQRGRAFKALVAELENEVGEPLGIIERTTLENAAAVTVMLGEMCERLVAGERCDADLYGRLTNLLNRLLSSLGLVPNKSNGKDENEEDVIDDLPRYLESHYGQALDDIDLDDAPRKVNGRRRLRSDLVGKG